MTPEEYRAAQKAENDERSAKAVQMLLFAIIAPIAFCMIWAALSK